MDDRTDRMFDLMRKETNRLKTFQMNPPWPKDYVDIKKLAKAGFFYAFSGDKVLCAFCRGQVNHWDRDDDPMAEHARHFTTCPFIMGGEVGNEPIGEDPFPGPKRPRPYDVCGTYPNFPPNDPRHQEELQEREQRSYPLTEEEPERTEQQESQQVEIQQPLQSDSESEISFRQQDSSIRDVPGHEASQADRTNVNAQDVHERIIHRYNLNQIQELAFNDNNSVINRGCASEAAVTPSSNLNGICKICYTNSIELVFLPCGHSVSCLSCAQRLFSCPCCRETITTRIRTYLV